MSEKKEKFLLSALPAYEYPLNLACPSCYKPLDSRKRKDGRCDACRKSKDLLPVNHLVVKKKKSDEDEDDRERETRYNRDE